MFTPAGTSRVRGSSARSRLITVGLVLAIAAAYFSAAELGLSMAFVAEQVTAVWPPTGIALVSLLVLGQRMWPGVALGAFLANVTVHEPSAMAAGIALGNTLEAVAGAWMLRRLVGFDLALGRLKDVLGLAVLAAALSTTIAATIGVSSLCLGGLQPWSKFWSLWWVWWLGDAMGDLVMAPLLLIVTWGHEEPWPSRKVVEAGALTAAFVLSELAVFGGIFTSGRAVNPMVYIVFPFVVWAALRFGQIGVVTVTFVASTIAVWGTWSGLGPFARESVNESLILLLAFMAVVGMTGLLLGAAINERRRAEAAQRLLAEAGRISSSSIDDEAALGSLCKLVVPVLGDWCVLDLQGDDGRARLLGVAHAQPAKVERVRELLRKYPPRPDDAQGITKVLRTGVAEPHFVLSEELRWVQGNDDERLQALRSLGAVSALVIPLSARGRTLGAMTVLTAESMRQYDGHDLQLAIDLGSRVALGVDNARLFEQSRESARRREEALLLHRVMEEQLTVLVQASGSLSASLDVSSVLHAILELSGRLIPADAYAIWRYRELGRRWQIELSRGLSEEYQQTAILDADDNAQVQGDGASQRLTDAPVIADDVSHSLQLDGRRVAYEREGIRSVLAVPLRMRGTLSGTLVFYFRTPHRFNQVEVRLATALSNLAASAIDTAELYDELRSNDRRKDEFLAMLAHELRNPIAAIKSAVAVAGSSSALEHVEWSHHVITRQIHHLTRLIDDLLDVSRISRGKIQLRNELVDIQPILESAVDSVRGAVDEKNHALTATLERGLYLEADPTRLEQVVVNLLTNAAKYTEAGGKIWLSARREGEEVVIRVRDTGVGIPPESLPKMFELFAQGDRSLARSEGGLGIGLTLVQKLTEMHGGRVSATSEGTGLGSEFIVRLPAARRPSPAEGRPAFSARERQAGRTGARILVIDDNPDTAHGMAKLLSLSGHVVRTAHDGPSAVVAAHELRPEVVLLDIGLPGTDGYQVARQLRTDERCQGALIIAVTGYGQADDQRKSREAGFDHHLIKPVDFDVLFRLIAGAAEVPG